MGGRRPSQELIPRLWIAWTVFAVLACAQEPALIVERWLEIECSQDDDGSLAAALKKSAAQAEPLLLGAAQNGPPPSQLREIRRRATRDYDRRLRYLRAAALAPEALARAREVTRQQYLARREQNYIVSYRSRAVCGLAYTGSEAAVVYLRSTAADPTSRLRTSALYALALLNQPPVP